MMLVHQEMKMNKKVLLIVWLLGVISILPGATAKSTTNFWQAFGVDLYVTPGSNYILKNRSDMKINLPTLNLILMNWDWGTNLIKF